MLWPALLKTILLCLVSIIIEAISASTKGKKWFESLRRPKYSFSLNVWYVVGAFYYIIFGIVAYRQFSMGKSFASFPIILLTAVMLLNGLSNFIIFKYRSVKWFYLAIYPFAFVLFALIFILWKDDKTSATLAFLYFLWLFYDLYYGYQMWKLNEQPR
jgi:tryptophan-rich sensory protein